MRKLTVLARLLSLTLAATAAEAADLTLYVDSATGQIFAEPGPNRVLMGTFRPVETEAPAASVVADTQAVPDSAAEPALAALENRVVDSEQKIAALEARSADRSRSPFTSRFSLRGYLQTRHTAMLGGDEGVNLWSDRSVGDDQSLNDADKNFLIRRARMVFQGDVGERLSFYIQPDFASSAGSTGNVAQMRDAYGDVYLTTDRVHRVRVGQSKVPYGWENMQSSSNRLALDRVDAMNSAVRDERDLGAFYYYTPRHVQALFDEINSSGLKHSGNYGMFGFGFYNGQGANRGDRNDNEHAVARFTYPWQLASGQIFEAGIQAYSGKYVPSTGAYRTANDASLIPTIANEFRGGFEDERVGLSFIWYPQPFGVQAEWNWGTSPQLDLATNSIVEEDVQGGYIQTMMKLDTRVGTFFPFIKWQYFDGANKAETNAPANDVNDWELGLEWQIAAEVELAAIWHRMKRTNLVTGNRSGRADYQQFEADALRLQLQFNY
ncbi:MAG: porin [Pseudomonadota bacterium]|nr:porin [Pseudomonadota bacterium]